MSEDQEFETTHQENQQDVKLPAVVDELSEKLKNFLKLNYEPVQDATHATLRLTTTEIYANLNRIYPDLPFSLQDLAQWLHQCGFTFWDAGNMRFEWLLKSTDTN